jgi:hypothetical protein
VIDGQAREGVGRRLGFAGQAAVAERIDGEDLEEVLALLDVRCR